MLNGLFDFFKFMFAIGDSDKTDFSDEPGEENVPRKMPETDDDKVGPWPMN